MSVTLLGPLKPTCIDAPLGDAPELPNSRRNSGRDRVVQKLAGGDQPMASSAVGRCFDVNVCRADRPPLLPGRCVGRRAAAVVERFGLD